MLRQHAGRKLEAGHYRVVNRDGRRVAKLSCPRCALEADLEAHEIHKDGRVEPSVMCGGCGWHENIWLQEWEPQQAVQRGKDLPT